MGGITGAFARSSDVLSFEVWHFSPSVGAAMMGVIMADMGLSVTGNWFKVTIVLLVIATVVWMILFALGLL